MMDNNMPTGDPLGEDGLSLEQVAAVCRVEGSWLVARLELGVIAPDSARPTTGSGGCMTHRSRACAACGRSSATSTPSRNWRRWSPICSRKWIGCGPGCAQPGSRSRSGRAPGRSAVEQQQGHHDPVFGQQDVEGPAGRAGVHDFHPHAARLYGEQSSRGGKISRGPVPSRMISGAWASSRSRWRVSSSTTVVGRSSSSTACGPTIRLW